MSQFPPPGYFDPTATPEAPRKTSGLAITALVMSLVGLCCLLTAPLGVLLGLIGLVTIAPPRKGKGMCVAAVIIGIIVTVIWSYFGWWSYKTFIKPMFEGPNLALKDGFAGNPAGFRAWFHGDGATASDDDVNAFIGELRTRYGELQLVRFDENSNSASRPQPGQVEGPFPYIIDFTNAKGVKAEGMWIFADQSSGGNIIMKMRSFTVFDSAKGDVVFPSAGSGSPARTTQPSGGGAPPFNGPNG